MALLQKILVGIFGLILITVLAMLNIKWDYPLEFGLAKGALMPVLIILTIVSVKSNLKSKKWLFAALVFSWIGDIMLLDDSKFIFGLASFLVAHVFYIFCFGRHCDENLEIPLHKKYPLFMFGYFILGFIVFIFLKDGAGEMMIPIVVYMAAILLMSMVALGRYLKTSKASFWMTFSGSLLFVISDAIIAFDKFDKPIDNASHMIMLTYGVAQLLIVLGILNHDE